MPSVKRLTLVLFLLLLVLGAAVPAFSQSSASAANQLLILLQASDSPLPPGAQLARVTIRGSEATVDLRLPPAFLADSFDAYRSDAIIAAIVQALHPLGLRDIHVRVADTQGVFRALSDFLPPAPRPIPTLPSNSDPAPDRRGPAVDNPPVPGQGQPTGALSGKTVWLSPGHGWLWNGSSWLTQRGNTFGIVEDFSNAEAVVYYLARYLWNAGANVWLVRERSVNVQEIVVDNDEGTPGYTETGTWTTSLSPGYGGLTYRYAYTANTATATATWTPTIPVAGWYPVYVWYLHSGNRSVDARYVVNHAGGETAVNLSQEVHGQTWRFLGEYYFDAGSAGSVTLINQSSDLDQVVIADAVRFGGGVGDSGEPRFEEAALHYAAFQGYGDAPNDVVARPLYAEWELAKGYANEDAVFLSWHTNCCNASGTESFIYDGEATPGSVELRNFVQAELISDLRAEWNPNWIDRGLKSANFGELRELSTMPGTLVEIAFHDTENPGDADDLKEPRFRQIAARAALQGIVRYFANRDGLPVHLLPETPTHLLARTTGTGQVTISWAAPPAGGAGGDAATSYKVYQSENGRGFDNGTVTNNTSLTVTGLQPGELRFFRVTALNAGGESFPTPVVAVRAPSSGGEASLLLVDGFDRLDKSSMITQYDGPTLGNTERMFLERMNRFDYAVEHAQALAGCDIAFDSAVNEVVAGQYITLANYEAVDWFVGEDSTANASLNSAERALLAGYLDNGGRLLISGAEIGYDLARPTYGVDPTFYQNYLKAAYVGDDANTYAFAGIPGGIFQGITGSFDDSSQGYYDVRYPDRLASSDGSTIALNYSGGTGDGAAVVYDGADFKVAHFGFPLEAVTDDAVRQALVCAAAGILLDAPPLTIDDPDYSIQYAGWSGAIDAAAYGGGYRSASAANEWMAYTTPATTAIDLITYRGPDQGRAWVLVDGSYQGTLDLYAPNPTYQAIETFDGLGNTPHTIVIIASGQQNPASSGTTVRVDGVIVNGAPIDDNAPELIYKGWVGVSAQPFFGGSARATTTANNTLTFTFSGSQFTWLTARCPTCGMAQVIVDGILTATINLYNPTWQFQVEEVIGGLSPGAHIAQIRVNGGGIVVFDGYAP
ncbi:MAG: hypothetical protein Fur0021_12470 [Candidatus Promineifilaceae bacterium]